MKKIFVLIFCLIVFMSTSGAFLWTMITENDIVLIVPTILTFMCACVFVFLLVKELFIGYNEYRIEASTLHVSRKGKRIASIKKEDIEQIVFICDMVNKDVEAITFSHRKKRFCVTLTDHNKEEYIAFFSVLQHQTKDNLWYYLISAFNH